MMRLLGDRVLVVLPPRETEQEGSVGYTYQHTGTTDSGIVLAKPSDAYDVRVQTRGIVVQLGEKSQSVDLDAVMAVLDDYTIADRVSANTVELVTAIRRLLSAPFDVAVGDCVIFSPAAGEPVSQDGMDYLILHESDLIGTVDPVGEERAWLERIAATVAETLSKTVESEAA